MIISLRTNQIKLLANMLFFLVISAYFFTIIIGSQFGVVDDHELIKSFYDKGYLPPYIIPLIGRFYPLDGQEYNVIRLFSDSPVAFYLFNATQFAVVVLLIRRMLVALGNTLCEVNYWFVYACILSLIISPGFVTAWFRLLVPERGLLFFTIIFISSFIAFQYSKEWPAFFVAIFAANVALYYKEPAFVMFSIFAAGHLLLGWKYLSFKQKILDIALMASTVIYVLIYYFLVYRHKGEISYGDTGLPFFVTFPKTLTNFLISDFMLISIVFSLLFVRIYKCLLKRDDSFHPVMDSALLAAFAYINSYLLLNIWSYHYLLPAYGFALLPTYFFLKQQEYWRLMIIKSTLLISLLFFIFNTIPVGLHLISFYKNVPAGYQETLSTIAAYISESKKPVVVYLDGVDRKDGVELFISLATYLNLMGVNNSKFTLKPGSEQYYNYMDGSSSESSTHFRNNEMKNFRVNELILISPYSTNNINSQYVKQMPNARLIFHYSPVFSAPNLGIKSILKVIFIWFNLKYEFGGRNVGSNALYWQDFYIFEQNKTNDL